jgi:hypothetical protein
MCRELVKDRINVWVFVMFSRDKVWWYGIDGGRKMRLTVNEVKMAGLMEEWKKSREK